jgi:alpha-tubulin suppressor-like RCC1 family protein
MGACIDTRSDPNNCGSCGTVCTTTDPQASGAACFGGSCEPVCNAPYTGCAGSCVDTSSDPNNCGSCGQVCAGWCTASACHAAKAIQVAAGEFHSCALLPDGTVECTGRNLEGELGNGTFTDSSTPVPVQDQNGGILSGVVALTATSMGNCALLDTGFVKCWGNDWYGELGDAGHQTTTTRPFADFVPGVSNVVAIDGGWDHMCAVIDGGSLVCWGSNNEAQQGNGNISNPVPPATVTGLLGKVVAVSLGYYDTCAVLDDGTAECWGYNQYGELGTGGITDAPYALPTPTRVQSLSGQALTGIAAISAGYLHTCALLTNGAVDCWGNNGNGQMGNGTVANDVPSPVPVLLPVAATSIGSGGFHTCATVAGGGVYCWGRNYVGQIGDGTTNQANLPVAVPGLHGVTAITGAAESTITTIAAWGQNTEGDLGDGTTIDSYLPVLVPW